MQTKDGRESVAQSDNQSLQAVSGEEQDRLSAIIDSWHKLEFFVPFDLDGRRKEVSERVRSLPRGGSLALSNLWAPDVPEGYELTGFYLYLCVFDKKQITAVCKQIAPSDNDAENLDEQERIDDWGTTCFAKLNISVTGEVVFKSERETLSISTVPWALGKIRNEGFSALKHSDFESARERLSELLLTWRSQRKPAASAGSNSPINPLSESELFQLHDLLCEWASFKPLGEPRAVIETRLRKKKTARTSLSTAAQASSDHHAVQAFEEDDATNDSEPEVDILNSFFTQDLERVASTIRSGVCPRALKSYLTPVEEKQRLDVDCPAGLASVLNVLHPSRTNAGRWLDDPKRPMSLMQQFAINLATEGANTNSLFSVNGPPGTGKTTLLQDVFAENIVRRARALSSLQQATDAFEKGGIAVHFIGESEPIQIVRLKPELTGFEMVVASSNNAAVENISRELPKVGRLAEVWRPTRYLQSVAHKIAAQSADGSVAKLPVADIPWGLISCALGNSKNRLAFRERFFFKRHSPKRKGDVDEVDKLHTIYEWIDSYKGATFRQSAENFKSADNKVRDKRQRLAAFADLLRDRLNGRGIADLQKAEEGATELYSEIDAIQSELVEQEIQEENSLAELTALQEDERLLERSSPGWWSRVRRTTEARNYRERVRQNAASQLSARQKRAITKTEHEKTRLRQVAVSTRLAQAKEALKQISDLHKGEEQRWQEARSEFPNLKLPDTLDQLASADFQKSGLWHDEELAELRTCLFVSALALHEAWIAEVAKERNRNQPCFHRNLWAIKNLLSNRVPENKANVAIIWQSLFMVIPVVSTTFSSFAAQFRDLGSASIGHLFIDEAGQAIPQAAAGALWRAKQALVVGDPLQIEPIFTLPVRFTAKIAELSRHTANGEYSPHRVSVQQLTDRANPFGTYRSNSGGPRLWIGTPLRVHRRCIDPMFRWANHIAYDDKMVFGSENREMPNGPPIALDSAWIDINGSASKQQVIPEQVKFVVDVLLALYTRDRTLPQLYVISPFRAVKNELGENLEKVDWTNGNGELRGPKKQHLRDWCSKRIGTVHTFQGKEEDTVIMILGGDRERSGSAQWAASKPNILNVALTRAKRRFYLVGDRQLWGELGPFEYSKEVLHTMTAEQFLSRLRNQAPGARTAAAS